MNDHKNLLHHVADWWQSRQERPHTANWSRWLPTPGNILFTLLMIGLLIFTQQTWANNGPESVNVPGPSATTVNYQGRLAAPDGTPKNGTFGMSFTIYDAANGGNLVWGPESHSAVPVTNGLFNVGLGSQTSGGIPTTVWNGDRYLQITVGGETLTPRELIRSVPIAGMALTVPDGAITQAHAPTLLSSPLANRQVVVINRVVQTDSNGNAFVNIADQGFTTVDAVVVSNGDMLACNCFMGTYSMTNQEIEVRVRNPDGSPQPNYGVRVMLAIQGQH